MISTPEVSFPVLVPERPDHIHVDDELWNAARPFDAEEDVYSLLSPTGDQLDAERRKFHAMDDGGPMPDLRPTSTDTDRVATQPYGIEQLSASLEDFDVDPAIAELYRRKLGEDTANYWLLGAAQNGDAAGFAAANRQIYGAPDPDVFAATAAWHYERAERNQDSKYREVREAADIVIRALGRHIGDSSILVPEPDLHKAIHDHYWRPGGYLALTFAGVELHADPVTATNGGDAAIQRMLDNLGSGHRIARGGWRMGVDEIWRPDDFELTQREFWEFLGHELRHAIERVNGMRSPARIASTGLDRHEQGNEGQAIVPELVVDPAGDLLSTYRGQELLGRSLVVGLGNGLAGRNMSIREAGRLLVATNQLFEYTRPDMESAEKAEESARDLAWQNARSAYMGTSGDGTAGTYLRPMIYMEGLVRFMDVLRTKGLHWLDISGYAKADFTNGEHVRLLRQAGVIPDTSAYDGKHR